MIYGNLYENSAKFAIVKYTEKPYLKTFSSSWRPNFEANNRNVLLYDVIVWTII